MEQVQKEYEGKVTFEVYDLENQEHVKVADKYGIRAIPTLIFLDKNGATSNTLIGFQPKEVITQSVENILK